MQTNNQSPIEQAKSTGLPGFLQSLAGYYSQFLETDFKGTREPKRKFAQKTGMNRTGIHLGQYDEFRRLIVGKLGQKTPASFNVKYGKYSATVSSTARAGISAAIKSIDTKELISSLAIIELKCSEWQNSNKKDFEELVETLQNVVCKSFDLHIVSRVLEVIKPVLENQSGVSSALGDIETFAEEIISIIVDEQFEVFAEAIGEAVYGNNSSALRDTLEKISNQQRIQDVLNTYFENFVAKDIFVELREMVSSQAVTENTQIYLNVSEVIVGRSKFPLYYIPLSVDFDKSLLRLEFSNAVYVNKKAIDFVLSYLQREHNLLDTNPILERILHKNEDETYFEALSNTFHKILAAIKVEGDVKLNSSGTSRAAANGVSVNNEVSISLFDKSDESIVNDYEALMVGLQPDSSLLGSFSDMIDSFLTKNPISIDAQIDREWDETVLDERLVVQSPLPLAEEQQKVLAAIRNPKSKFIIVEGPPGTGKSHTISAIAFELILSGKNILILSDKNEALDVVESKLNSVITKARGAETEYVNPLLRLGKHNSNYSNIIKKSSIDKLKTSVRTFKANEKNFNKEFSSSENSLKARVVSTVEAIEDITFNDISEFHKNEAELFDRIEGLRDLSSVDEQQIITLALVRKLLVSDRKKFAAIGQDLPTLKTYLRLMPVIAEVPEEICSIAMNFPDLKLLEVKKLTHISDSIRSLRWPVFGYLFARREILELARQVENITGVFDLRPQEKLGQYDLITKLPETLASIIASFGASAEQDLAAVYKFLPTGDVLAREDGALLKEFSEQEWQETVVNLLPVSIKGLLGADESEVNILNDFENLMGLKRGLKDKFSQVPDFDYLQEKTQLEQMNTLKLVNCIDERVTEFAVSKRADARTLQQIIRNKTKFPISMFNNLSEAFPCMIAGLRDFAEFIPLESNLFDLVVIDEASQVSIAQALPAILRAKKVLVLGDRRQFGNVKTANASKKVNSGSFKQVMDVFDQEVGDDVSQKTRAGNFNITHSVMDFFELSSNFTIQLKKHFRGYPEMISFSSKYVYPDGLQALKIRGKPISEVLEFVETPDPERLETLRNANAAEADVIIERLNVLLDMDKPPSVAIITPHREQVTYLQKRLSDEPRREELYKKLRLAVFTFDTCQGEEREIIFYSMVANRNLDNLKYIFPRDLDLSEDEIDGSRKFQRLNVGFSRGMEKLIFVLSKPVEEYQGAIKRVFQHYKDVINTANQLPEAADTDQSSPMEARVLEWLKATSFVSSNADRIEIVPQFDLGAYLKALNPSYSHAAYKVDFLIRLQTDSDIQQCIIEYDGFEFHFVDHASVDAGNWRSYLTEGDIEREFILESFGYKMLRINRFNIGSDPVETLDNRLSELFNEFKDKDLSHSTVVRYQTLAKENIEGLEVGTHKKCAKCDQIKPISNFADASLKSNYGNNCQDCKNTTGQRRYRAKPTSPSLKGTVNSKSREVRNNLIKSLRSQGISYKDIGARPDVNLDRRTVREICNT